jgi:hypothetical protein
MPILVVDLAVRTHIGMSACLQRSRRRSQRIGLPSLREPCRRDRKGMGRAGWYCWSAGQRRGLGERLGRLCLRPGRDRSTAWFRLAAGLLARLRGIRVKVTAAWPHVCAGTGPVMPPSSAAVWNTG